MKALTVKQKWFLDYLIKRGDFCSPTNAGNAYGKAMGSKAITVHSSTASPVFKSLVKLGLAERNRVGYYRYVLSDDEQKSAKDWSSQTLLGNKY